MLIITPSDFSLAPADGPTAGLTWATVQPEPVLPSEKLTAELRRTASALA